MLSPRTSPHTLTAAFLLIIFGVSLTQAVIEAAHGQRPQCTDVLLRAPSEASLRAFEKDLEDASWFANTLRPLMQSLHFAILRDLGDKALLGHDDWVFYKPGVQYLTQPWPTGDATSAIIAFRDRLAERGIHLLVVPAPGKASACSAMLASRADHSAQPRRTHTLELMGRLKEAGVEVADLFEAFSLLEDPPKLYLSQDTHWTPEGARIAAKHVAARLLELGWVDRGTAEYEPSAVSIERRGDILTMMKAPRIEDRFERETVHCEQVVLRGTGKAYADETDAEILVLGDSFLRIYQKDEPGSAGFIAHLAKELGMPLASIVNDGGASTLVRQELKRKPRLLAGKKAVVWEFVERDIRFGTEGWQDVPLPKAAG